MDVFKIIDWFLSKDMNLINVDLNKSNKLYKLLYISKLHYKVLYNEILFDDDFIYDDDIYITDDFKNKLIIFLKNYKYNSIKHTYDNYDKINKMLHVIWFMFKDEDDSELLSSINLTYLPKYESKIIDFNNISNTIKDYVYFNYHMYSEVDYENLIRLDVNDNIFYYPKDINLSNEDYEYLKTLNKLDSVYYIDKINGELIFS